MRQRWPAAISTAWPGVWFRAGGSSRCAASWARSTARSRRSGSRSPRSRLNALLAYALIYGAFGLPRLDLLGAGIATTIVNIGMCVAGVWVCYALPAVQEISVLGRFWRADWPLFGRLVAIGAPISGAFLLEYGLFAAAAPADGLDRHHRARRASDRAHGGRDHVHGAVRDFDGGDRAGRPCRRPPRCRRHPPGRLRGDRARRQSSWPR